MTSVVSASGVGKRYRHAPLRTKTLKDRLLRASGRHGRSFWALRDVSFEVDRGRTLGIVGPNGAGKSTLLRLLAGVGRPDEGRVRVTGRLGTIFELGTGFHPDLTGRESAMLTGVISGLPRTEIRRRMRDIGSFAELEEFLDDPVRTYSSGMVARLAFSIAIHVDADTLLIDEAIAVGDLAFQQRCLERLRTIQQAGATMVIVSHSPAALRELCDEVLWLQGGRVEARGAPEDVSALYASKMRELAQRVTPEDLGTEMTADGIELRPHEHRLGSQHARITSVHLADRWGESILGAQIASGDAIQVFLEMDAPAELGALQLAVHLIRDDDGVLCVDCSTPLRPSRDGSSRRSIRLECSRLDLGPGRYACEIGLYSADWTHPYDYHAGAYRFAVGGGARGSGVLAPPLVWHLEQSDLRVEG